MATVSAKVYEHHKNELALILPFPRGVGQDQGRKKVATRFFSGQKPATNSQISDEGKNIFQYNEKSIITTALVQDHI